MSFFHLPSRTKVGRVVPKNTFDPYTNTNQKKQFTDHIQRITWTHKISSETVNLPSIDISEIQLFKVELKQRTDILKVLEIINKSIPYHIVFWVEFNTEAFVSTAAKHPHPTNEDLSVIDWTFTSDWFPISTLPYSFHLKGSLDAVFKDICIQITGKPEFEKKSMDSILQNVQEIDQLKRDISKLKSAIASSKQFNKKAELNNKLNTLKETLSKVQEIQ